MIILTETTDKIQIVLGSNVATSQLQCVASYRDITTNTYTAGRNVVTTNNITDVDLVGSPDASTQRVIDYIRVYNNDTTRSTVTLKFNANGSEYILYRTTLSTGETLEYVEGNGFSEFDINGALKSSINQPSGSYFGSLSVITLSADYITSLSAITDVSGLFFNVRPYVTYFYRFVIHFENSNPSLSGTRWTIDGPTQNLLTYTSTYSLSTATQTTNNAANNYNLPLAPNARSASVASNICTIEGFVRPTAQGAIKARVSSGGPTITAKTGSMVIYQELI